MQRVSINANYCKGCLICVEICPRKALAPSEKINSKGFVLPVENGEKECNGCRMCELVCPDFAIAIESKRQ